MNRKHLLYQTHYPMNAARTSAAGKGRGVTVAVVFLLVAIGCFPPLQAAEPRTGNGWALRNLRAREEARDEMADLDLYHNCAVLTDLLAVEGEVPEQMGRLMPLEKVAAVATPSRGRLPLMTMDPWGKPYLYWAYVGGFVLISTGRDGKQQEPYAEWLASNPKSAAELWGALGCSEDPARDRGDDLIYLPMRKCP